jgi:hypothetical protein
MPIPLGDDGSVLCSRNRYPRAKRKLLESTEITGSHSGVLSPGFGFGKAGCAASLAIAGNDVLSTELFTWRGEWECREKDVIDAQTRDDVPDACLSVSTRQRPLRKK